MQYESERYFFFDNARALLILLVIFGHFFEPVMNAAPAMRALYLLIYSFHVPALAFISGFLSKGYKREGKQSDLLRRFLIPYFFAQIILFMFNRYYLGSPFPLEIFIPSHALWYLMSLFLWFAMLPFMLRFRFPVLISILLALSVGYSPRIGQLFSLSRTFVFLPFFLSGHFFDISHVKRLKRPAYKVVSVVYFISLGLSLYVIRSQIDHRWLLGLYSYSDLGYSEWYAFVFRMALLPLQFAGTLALLSLLPERRLLFTETGRRSIYPYVLHIFVYYWLYKTGLYYIANLGLIMLPIIFVFAVAVYFVFSSKIAVRITKPVIEPKLRFLFE